MHTEPLVVCAICCTRRSVLVPIGLEADFGERAVGDVIQHDANRLGAASAALFRLFLK
nr:hypothetical protein [Streptomyces sp. TLI_235]